VAEPDRRLRAHDVPVALVNARLSERSLRAASALAA
jgi:3-deoxy-D-manno-octulosonic-acid transferase